MDTSPAESELRTVIADGLDRLNRSHGGRYLSTVARRLGVDRSTVSRWRQQRATARPDHCEELARVWSTYFDLGQLLDLHYRSLRLGQVAGHRANGIEILSDTATVFAAATEETRIEPTVRTDRMIRHSAFHLEDIGTNPLTNDEHFKSDLVEHVVTLRGAISERARQGWDVKAVVSAGSLQRLEAITDMVHNLDGPAVEIFAYPFRLPLVMAPYIVSNRTVFLAYDHRRWELAGSAMMIRSREAANWASRYFDDLIADAPFRLRRPSGIDRAELERFGRALI